MTVGLGELVTAVFEGRTGLLFFLEVLQARVRLEDRGMARESGRSTRSSRITFMLSL